MSGLPPWHMWGAAAPIQLDIPDTSVAVGAGLVSASQQTTRVDYGRPDTWKFFFAARVLSLASGAVNATFDVAFDVIFGLGRTSITLPNFELYTFTNYPAAPGGGPPSQYIWSTEVIAPSRSVTDTNPSKVTSIVAQQINVNARVTLRNIAAPSFVKLSIEAHSYFAPLVHIRPEWEEGRFPGDETEGH